MTYTMTFATLVAPCHKDNPPLTLVGSNLLIFRCSVCAKDIARVEVEPGDLAKLCDDVAKLWLGDGDG